LELAGESARLVRDVAVIAKRGAAGADGVVEDLKDAVHQCVKLFFADAGNALEGVEFRQVECFIHINVA
jgi:hypothetical protein